MKCFILKLLICAAVAHARIDVTLNSGLSTIDNRKLITEMTYSTAEMTVPPTEKIEISAPRASVHFPTGRVSSKEFHYTYVSCLVNQAVMIYICLKS